MLNVWAVVSLEWVAVATKSVSVAVVIKTGTAAVTTKPYSAFWIPVASFTHATVPPSSAQKALQARKALCKFAFASDW